MRHNEIPALLLALALLLTGCGPAAGETEPSPAVLEPAVTDMAPAKPPAVSEPPEESPEEPDPLEQPGDIWLYGESHGNKDILEEELRLWKEAYDRGVRHLFGEHGYYAAEFLNLWMAAEDDAILEQLYADWEGTASHNSNVKEFYQQIKADFPETVFHGTDVGHQYGTTGARYLAYLREHGQEDTEQYRLAQTCIEQGQKFYSEEDFEYREAMLTENFIRALERLDGEEIVGFYGAAHVRTLSFSSGSQTAETSMASRLLERYGERLHLLDLTHMAIPELKLEPERTDNIQVGERTYEASYFGKVDISSWSRYLCREFWRLEDAYDDFRGAPKTGDVLPYDNYPTQLEAGQVYVIDYTAADGTVERHFYRSDGNVWQGMATTEEFLPPE